jgi:two-component system, OmpR family, phosphate regulon response regulator OmpR
MNNKGRILVVDDEPDVRETLREYLEASGFEVYVAGDGDGVRKVVEKRRIDVVLMDLNLPGEDGLALTRQLRATHSMGVIMITAAGQTVDRIVGLEMGADDYIPKPFDLREVLARVRSLLRRLQERPRAAQAAPEDKPDIVKMGSCVLDLAAHRLFDGKGNETPLTNTEFDLLRVFAQHPDRVFSRQQLLNMADNRSDQVFDRSIDLRIMRLRRKIESDPDHPQVLKTVRGAGYMFVSRRPGR